MDLDLTSLNRFIKTPGSQNVLSIPVPRRRRDSDDENDMPSENDAPSPNSLNGSTDRTKSNPKSDQGLGVEIIELDSHNPLIRYHEQVYSCTWTDMVGTNMFLNRPGDEVVADPLTRTREYDLIGTSRIKLVGHLAKVAEIPKGRKRDRSSYEDEGETDQQTKQQADFLERLMDIKKGRGETDNVAVIFSDKPVINGTRSKQPSDELSLEIAGLNRQVLKGDEEARKRLLEINSQLEEDERLQPQPGLDLANDDDPATPNILPSWPESPNDHG